MALKTEGVISGVGGGGEGVAYNRNKKRFETSHCSVDRVQYCHPAKGGLYPGGNLQPDGPITGGGGGGGGAYNRNFTVLYVYYQQGSGSQQCDGIPPVHGQAAGGWNCWCVMVLFFGYLPVLSSK